MGAEPLKPARWKNTREQPSMLEWMTEQEWIRRYPDEFVLVIDPDWDEQKGLQAGYVAFHSPEEQETFAEATRLKPRDFGCPFTGIETEGVQYLL